MTFTFLPMLLGILALLLVAKAVLAVGRLTFRAGGFLAILVVIPVVGLFIVRKVSVPDGGRSVVPMRQWGRSESSNTDGKLYESREKAFAVAADVVARRLRERDLVDWQPGRPFTVVVNPRSNAARVQTEVLRQALRKAVRGNYPHADPSDIRIVVEERGTARSARWNGEGIQTGRNEVILDVQEEPKDVEETALHTRLLAARDGRLFVDSAHYRYKGLPPTGPIEMDPTEESDAAMPEAIVQTEIGESVAPSPNESGGEAVDPPYAVDGRPEAVPSAERLPQYVLDGNLPQPVEPGRNVSPVERWFRGRAVTFQAALLLLMLVLGYVFLGAGRRGAWAWPLRVGSAVAFVSLCLLLLKMRGGMIGS